jgi:retinol dehydrogenase 14
MSKPGEMSGKIVMVTGANAGIGKETALALAKLGARVVCVCRDRGRGEAAVAEIRQRSGNDQVELMLCDLSSQQSIRAFAEEYKRTHDRLHVLVNNAGVVIQNRQVTVDGLEATFALDHLGYFLLAHLLLDVIKASAPARIVNVSSDAHRAGRIDFDDLQFEKKKYAAFGAYCQAKLANIMFTYDLAERLEGTGVTVNAVHPGPVNTNFGSDSTGFFNLAMRVFKLFALTPEQGAQTSIYAASSPEVEGLTGKYWSKNKPVKSKAESYDVSIRKRLWELSERMTGLAPGQPAARAG